MGPADLDAEKPIEHPLEYPMRQGDGGFQGIADDTFVGPHVAAAYGYLALAGAAGQRTMPTPVYIPRIYSAYGEIRL